MPFPVAVSLLLLSAAGPAEPKVDVWFAPAGAVFAVEETLRTHDAIAYLPLGANISLTPRWGASLELSWLHGNYHCNLDDEFCRGSAAGAVVTLGVRLHLVPDPEHSGPFLHFKVLGATATDYDRQGQPLVPDAIHAGQSWSLGTGVDLGYDVRIGALYVAPVIGISLDYHEGASEPLATHALLYLSRGYYRGPGGVGFSTNFNFVRLGATL